MADPDHDTTISLASALKSRATWVSFLAQTEDVRAAAYLTATDETHLACAKAWLAAARDDQWPPEGDWTTWLMLGGRGAGKTRAGAEWVKAVALTEDADPSTSPGSPIIALIGETLADVRDVMVEGPSGLIAIHADHERPRWIGTKRRLEWENGAVALAFSSEDPESLRGPQFSAAWCDELAKWRYPDATFDMLQFGLRLGDRPRQVVTTTPRPIPLVRRLISEAGTVVSRARTADNAGRLPPAFLDAIVARYRGTRLGRQELDAELIEDSPDALWQRHAIEAARVSTAPEMRRIVVGVDPPAGSGDRSAACGIVAAGLGADGLGYVIADATAERLTPAAWARRAVDLYHRLKADRIVAEANQGGEMVAAVIRQADGSVPILVVHASRGKYLRSEPVAALYERGRVKHVGAFPALEDEMCNFGLGGLASGRSPDRLDALVWALWELMIRGEAEPRIRGI